MPDYEASQTSNAAAAGAGREARTFMGRTLFTGVIDHALDIRQQYFWCKRDRAEVPARGADAAGRIDNL